MRELLQLPGPGGGGAHPGALESFHQFDGRIRTELRIVECGAHPRKDGLHLRRAADSWSGPQEFGEQFVVSLMAPRESGEPHLGRDERPNALPRQQECEPAGPVAALDGRTLASPFHNGIVVDGRRFKVEQHGRRGARIGWQCRRVPATPRGASEFRGRRGCGAPQDSVAQAQVHAPLDPHARREQARIPVRRVIPDPARMIHLALAHPLSQCARVNLMACELLPRVLEFDRGDHRGGATHGDVHTVSLPRTTDRQLEDRKPTG